MGINSIFEYAYIVIALLSAIIPHEIAHGYVAYKLGDNTAKEDGRLSLNPLNHIDPMGLLFMVIFRFGWAKAVPINSWNFENRKQGTILVSLAGVTANFLLAFIFSLLMALIQLVGLGYYQIHELLMLCLWYNVMLGVFNLVPLPPLDGSKVIATLLPTKYEYLFYKYEKYFYIFLIIGVFTGTVSSIIGPIIQSLIYAYLQLSSGIINAFI